MVGKGGVEMKSGHHGPDMDAKSGDRDPRSPSLAQPLSLVDAQRAYEAACAEERGLEREISHAVEEAKRAVRERFSNRTRDVQERRVRAYRDLVGAQDRLPAHEWDGKRVYKLEYPGRYSWERKNPVRVEGIVETRRSTSDFPVNTAGYSLPRIGEGFVRLLKKDGTPGAKFDRSLRDWKLVEEAPAGEGGRQAPVV